jgi:sugar O-acyltransferase (sialic acid O-acetyltransferase NeuD family)
MTRLAMVSIDSDLIDTILAEGVHELLGVFDHERANQPTTLPRLGSDAEWPTWSEAHPDVYALLAIDVPKLRKKLLAHYGADRMRGFIAITANISARARLGAGVIAQRSVDISAGVSIGDYTKIAIGATIHHDCAVGNFATLAPGCRLLGNVSVGDGCYIGSGAIVLPWVTIGEGATVGAGAVVTEPVEAGTTVVGIPAKAMVNKRG